MWIVDEWASVFVFFSTESDREKFLEWREKAYVLCCWIDDRMFILKVNTRVSYSHSKMIKIYFIQNIHRIYFLGDDADDDIVVQGVPSNRISETCKTTYDGPSICSINANLLNFNTSVI